MPTFIQRRNPALADNFRPDFLSIKDRNLYVELYNGSSIEELSITAATVAFVNTRYNCAVEMFTVESNQITVLLPGVYEFFYKFNVGTGSGAAGTTSVSTWLEQSIDGGGFNEVSGSRSYAYAPPSPGWNNVSSSVTLFLRTSQIPSTYRIRSTVVAPAGTPTAEIHQEGRIFRSLCLIGLY